MPHFDDLQVLLREGQPAGATAKTLTGAVGYQLLYESQIVDDTPVTTQRVYLLVDGGENGAIVHTHNARWNGSQWVRDATADSFKTVLPNLSNPALSIRSVYPSASASPWGDGSWQDIIVEGSDAGYRGLIQLIGNHPIGTAPSANALAAMNICKAWGYLEYNAGVITKLDGYNLNAAGLNGAGPPDHLDLSFHTNMSTANYSVVVTDNHVSNLNRVAKATNLLTSGFKVYFYDTAGHTQEDAAGIQGHFSFQVFGRQ